MVTSDDGKERHLHCSSSARVAKEEAMVTRYAERFEQALARKQKKMAGKKARRKMAHLNQWLGRLKARSRGIGQHDKVDFVVDPKDPLKASSLRWTKKPLPKTMVTTPGTYCLRSNRLDLAPEEMWHHYVMLTDVEAVFRTLKSELGLRPLYHHKQMRADGHLFMTVLADQLVHVIRRRLQAANISWSWSEIRRIRNRHQRVSASFCRSDGTRIEIRRSTQAEAKQVATMRLWA